MRLPLQNSPKFALVDDDYDGEWLSYFRWRLVNGHVQHFKLRPGKSGGSLARMAYGESLIPAKHLIGHKNGDNLDCRTSNLVCLSYSDFFNFFRKPVNAFHHRNNESGFRGVVVQLRGDKEYIRAVCRKELLRTPDGSTRWPTLGEAAKAYDKKALEIWGSGAILNYEESKHANH